MRTSIEIRNLIRASQLEQTAVPADAEDRAEQLFTIQGRIQALESELDSVLEAEAEVRASLQNVGVGITSQARGLAEMAFGPRAQFDGVQPGFRAAVTIPAGMPDIDPSLPAFPDYPRGFVDTLQQATCTGSVIYLRRGAKTNAAAQWASGGTKAESAYQWTPHTAPLAWIAHHAPIEKTQASDWGQLDSMLRGEMMLGLRQAKSRDALVGANAAGITGITNTVGIQTATVAGGDTVYDAIRRAVTRVILVSGFYPTHVAVSPQVDEALDLLKDENKQYLAVKVGNRVWNLEIVQDNGLTVHDADAGLTHYGFIVYASVGATWHTKETDNVEIGLVANQFIENAYTLLAEGRHALSVRFPDAFCYCQDAITAVADESSPA
jgi:hypothetical protein